MSKIKQMPHVTVEQVLSLRDAAIKIEQERDELAAQVERLRECAILSQNHDWETGFDRVIDDNGNTFFDHDEVQTLWDMAHSETTPDALVSLKAQWQAEDFSEAAVICESLIGPYTYDMAADALNSAADELRQRAKEHNQ